MKKFTLYILVALSFANTALAKNKKTARMLSKSNKSNSTIAKAEPSSKVQDNKDAEREKVISIIDRRLERVVQDELPYRHSFAYSGLAFSSSALSFPGYSEDDSLVVRNIDSAMFTKDSLGGIMFRTGYGLLHKYLFFATELNYNIQFSYTDSLQNSLSDSVYIGGFDSAGNGNTSLFALNFKIGLNLNRNRAGLYFICGPAYNLLSISHENSLFATELQDYSANGFAVNYGIGMSHMVYKNLHIFAEFTIMPSIAASGNKNLDRGLYSNDISNNLYDSFDPANMYFFSIGLDYRY